MENNTSIYLILFKDGSSMNLNWSSTLITSKELESYLSVISDKYDILKFNRIK